MLLDVFELFNGYILHVCQSGVPTVHSNLISSNAIWEAVGSYGVIMGLSLLRLQLF